MKAALPTGMVQIEAPVLEHRRIAKDHYLMRLKSPLIAQRAKPGQFIHVRCGDADFPLLRRPLSLLDLDAGAGTIVLIYKVVGLGTAVLSGITVGSKVDVLGPLGHPFKIPGNLKSAYLVGGGVGIPPLYLLAKHLKKTNGCEITVFLGARTKEWVICAPDFKKLGVIVHTATDDGSTGYRGSVVDLLRERLQSERPDSGTTLLYICGPTPMMAAAAKAARTAKIPAQVSLEERMGCAIGCCWGCVVEIATEPHTSHSRFQRVCTEGPVFSAEELVWER